MQTLNPTKQQRILKLILYFELNVNEIFSQAKKYVWPRPDICPKCGGYRLWGHGYVQRYFIGFKKRLWLKRYRCVDCHGVHTIRPGTHWRRFQSDIKTIVQSLRKKLQEDMWQKEHSRQKQQYWFRGFKKQLLRAGVLWRDRVKRLEIFLKQGIILSSHSMQCYSASA